MTDKVKQAIRVLRSLPSKVQERTAQAIIDSGVTRSAWRLTDEQVAEIERRMKRKNRTFLTTTQVRKRLRHFGV